MGKVFCKPQDDSCDISLSPKSKHVQFTSFDYNDYLNDGKKVKICKVVVLGNDSLTKTKLIRQYTGDNNKMNKRLEVNNTIYDLAIWDVPNNIFSKFDMSSIYCQNAMAAIIIIDVTNPNALNTAYELIQSVKTTNKNIPIIILCNKWNDNLRLFKENEIESFCIGIQHFVAWQKINTDDKQQQIKIDHDKIIKQMIKKIITLKLKSLKDNL